MLINNLMREEQLESFVDNDHEDMDDFYDLMESDLDDEEIEVEMKDLIRSDEFYFDPYNVLIDLLFRKGRRNEAHKLIDLAYRKAVMKIADKDGNWPKEMLWGFIENRHLMRIIERYAHVQWEKGDKDTAIDIFRRLLRANPGDNQGVRYYILAILEARSAKNWDKTFVSKQGGKIIRTDHERISNWFEKGLKKHPDEFSCWLKKAESEEVI